MYRERNSHLPPLSLLDPELTPSKGSLSKFEGQLQRIRSVRVAEGNGSMLSPRTLSVCEHHVSRCCGVGGHAAPSSPGLIP